MRTRWLGSRSAFPSLSWRDRGAMYISQPMIGLIPALRAAVVNSTAP